MKKKGKKMIEVDLAEINKNNEEVILDDFGIRVNPCENCPVLLEEEEVMGRPLHGPIRGRTECENCSMKGW